MSQSRHALRTGALWGAILVALLAGWSKKDPSAKAEKTEATKPGIAETKAIAEEGFIYGLPLVMNYAVMYEFAVDTKSSQFKAPFNEIKNEHRVATYEDTAVITPNSDTPYSMLWLDLRAEPMVISVPAVEKERYYSVQLIDGNTYNYGYIGSRATGNEPGDYLVVGPTGRARRPRASRRSFPRRRRSRSPSSGPSSSIPSDMPNVEKVQAGYKAQPLSAFLKQPAPPAAPKIDFLPATTEGIKDNFYEYLDAALQFVPPSTRGQGHPGQARHDRHRAGQDVRVQGSVAGTQGRRRAGHEGGRRQGGQVSGQRNEGTSTAGTSAAFFGDRAFYKGNWLMRAGRCQGRHLRERCRGGHVSHYPHAWPTARRSTAASTTTRSPSPPGSSRR